MWILKQFFYNYILQPRYVELAYLELPAISELIPISRGNAHIYNFKNLTQLSRTWLKLELSATSNLILYISITKQINRIESIGTVFIVYFTN